MTASRAERVAENTPAQSRNGTRQRARTTLSEIPFESAILLDKYKSFGEQKDEDKAQAQTKGVQESAVRNIILWHECHILYITIYTSPAIRNIDLLRI